jgi:hypothetical protein
VLAYHLGARLDEASAEPARLEDVDRAAGEPACAQLGDGHVADRKRDVSWPIHTHDDRIRRDW